MTQKHKTGRWHLLGLITLLVTLLVIFVILPLINNSRANDNTRLDPGASYDQLAGFQQQRLVEKDIAPESVIDTSFVETYNAP
jgi:hypothetical protein